MMKMTQEERDAWLASRDRPWRQNAATEAPVDANSPQGRQRYIQFLTEAAAFCRARKPVRFHGKHWKL